MSWEAANKIIKPSEIQVKRKYEAEGWMMIRGGAPDFLAFNPETRQVVAVEVKQNGRLEENQSAFLKALQIAGVEVRVEWVE